MIIYSCEMCYSCEWNVNHQLIHRSQILEKFKNLIIKWSLHFVRSEPESVGFQCCNRSCATFIFPIKVTGREILIWSMFRWIQEDSATAWNTIEKLINMKNFVYIFLSVIFDHFINFSTRRRQFFFVNNFNILFYRNF